MAIRRLTSLENTLSSGLAPVGNPLSDTLASGLEGGASEAGASTGAVPLPSSLRHTFYNYDSTKGGGRYRLAGSDRYPSHYDTPFLGNREQQISGNVQYGTPDQVKRPDLSGRTTYVLNPASHHVPVYDPLVFDPYADAPWVSAFGATRPLDTDPYWDFDVHGNLRQITADQWVSQHKAMAESLPQRQYAAYEAQQAGP